ncbi:MAG TPA: tetratricopeptide repeat protein [Acidobacteria bacterium]|nr:tetratricopeptide repeat protein [Acidobacteriota bacterium]
MIRLWPVFVIALLVSISCGTRVPIVTTPEYPNFVFPGIPTTYGGGLQLQDQQSAWAFLQTGDLNGAKHRFEELLEMDSNFFPAVVGLGWVDLAEGRFQEAAAQFRLALDQKEDYVSALVGHGDALYRLNDIVSALKSYRFAVKIKPSLLRVERIVAELSLQVMTDQLVEARQFGEDGRLTDSEQAYREVIQGSPGSAFLYVELARIKQQQNELSEALVVIGQALALDDTYAEAFLLQGDLFESNGELELAVSAYTRANAIAPSELTADALSRARSGLRAVDLPTEYREIVTKGEITRGELAALLGVELGGLLRDAGSEVSTPIFTDTRNYWASQWVIEVARAGVMNVDGRYQFEPGRVVRRGGLAEIVAATLLLIAEFDPESGRRWRAARPRFTDLTSDHLNFDSASIAVGADVLDLSENGRFLPTRVVSGRDAADVVAKLTDLFERVR